MNKKQTKAAIEDLGFRVTTWLLKDDMGWQAQCEHRERTMWHPSEMSGGPLLISGYGNTEAQAIKNALINCKASVIVTNRAPVETPS